jgi:predicted amidohydrolase
MKVGFVQFAPKIGKTSANVKHANKLISRTNADLLVLPELCNTGYVFRSEREVSKLAEPIPDGETCRQWEHLAEERGLYIVAGITEQANHGYYNSAVMFGPQGFIGTYRKSHLFLNEKRYFKPGDTGFNVFKAGKTKIGIMICFDWIFPEATRILALKGAEIIAHPSNLIFPYCMEAMRTRAVENHVYAITCNRIGTERGTTFHGESQVVSPDMRVLAKAGEREEAQIVEIDPAEARKKEYTPVNNIFKDRRVELYWDLLLGEAKSTA